MTLPSYSTLSVIVIEDVRATRCILKGLLRGLGFQDIVEARDGSEALLLLKTQQKDLIITDLSMVPVDGLEFVRRLRHPSNINAFTPVLMISAHNEKSKIELALAAGVSAFLLKPVIPTVLGAKLHSLLKEPTHCVKSAFYHGPDRRRRTAWVRKERRSKPVTVEL